ncbi:MAG TPA: PEP-CTERM sorting domain-containing protein [Telluria sp.]|jgi:hypothetical protein
MSIPSIARAAALLLTCVTVSPAQATIVTFTSGGTIASGADYLDIFHTGPDLGGKSYTQSITMDTDVLDVRELSPGVNARLTIYGPVKVQGMVTVDGHSYVWDIGFGIGEANMWNSSATPRFPLSFMGVHGYGPNALDGQIVMAGADYADDSASFLPSVDFAQRQYLSGLLGYAAHADFAIRAHGGVETFFGANPEWVRWEGVNPVPEPATAGLFMLGLGLAAARRRQARNAR